MLAQWPWRGEAEGFLTFGEASHHQHCHYTGCKDLSVHALSAAIMLTW
jgi:hypothetical protein